MRIIEPQPNNAVCTKEERIAPLSVLPVFYKLEGARVLVAGGSEAAAWKAHLVAAAGARIELYCEEKDDAFDRLLGIGNFVWHQRPWDSAALGGHRLAICDAQSEGEAQAFRCAGHAAGVPVNVIDKPAFCDFQFGSIVNRSPAVIAISTDGAAPVLGQAIRRRIETLLPPSLARWAALARDIRAEVTDRLAPGGERRRFWERFVDRAFATAEPQPETRQFLLAESRQIAADNKDGSGRVTLVGAGPGDAELLTLKAIRALQSADVILFDDLVSQDVLELARREARRMLVGKRGRRESCKQEDINATMVTLAKSGKHVVRLKGGDPMVFGRAGEEIARLNAENIPVSVVPGITSALAMASSLGVSLTHRDHAQAVRFITGHSRKGELPTDVDWQSVADTRTTTIFYMGGRTAAAISQMLQAHGLAADTPCVMVSAVSRAEERRWTGTLAQLTSGAEHLGLDNPMLIGIGPVFGEIASSCGEGSTCIDAAGNTDRSFHKRPA